MVYSYSMKDAFAQKNPANQFFAYLIIYAGLIELLSSFIINPWIGKFWRHKPIIQVYDVMLTYFFWSFSLGILTLLVGLLAIKTKTWLIEKIALSYLVISLFLLSDRLLLAGFGLPLWIPDTKIHYRNRPNALRSWGEKYQGKLIHFNRYGHHDDNFPREKPTGEFRGIVLGDSVSMGHGVTSGETFANQLENILKKHNPVYNSYQIINSGVQGYSLWQEYQIFREGLEFKPDFCALGFCMNDVTEPFSVNRNLGGPGLDYQGVMQTPNFLLGYLINETGYGRLILGFVARSKFRQVEKLQQIYNPEYMLSHSLNDPRIKGAWNITLNDLSRIKHLADERKINFILLIFPFTCQLFNADLNTPQKILITYAQEHNIEVIDFTEVFRNVILEDIAAGGGNKQGLSKNSNFQKLYPGYISLYFLDEDHLTARGHQIVAEEIFKYLKKKGF